MTRRTWFKRPSNESSAGRASYSATATSPICSACSVTPGWRRRSPPRGEGRRPPRPRLRVAPRRALEPRARPRRAAGLRGDGATLRAAAPRRRGRRRDRPLLRGGRSLAPDAEGNDHEPAVSRPRAARRCIWGGGGPLLHRFSFEDSNLHQQQLSSLTATLITTSSQSAQLIRHSPQHRAVVDLISRYAARRQGGRDRRGRRRGDRRPLDDEFPLVVWQTGSGTQTNMNVNEVIANRANELLGGPRRRRARSCTRTMTSTAASRRTTSSRPRCTSPRSRHRARNCSRRCEALRDDARREGDGVRRHRQDRPHAPAGRDAAHARPGDLRLGRAARSRPRPRATRRCPHLRELALGGTAVGTGLNAHPEFGARRRGEARRLTGLAFVTAPNKFEALAGHEALCIAHGALKTLAAALMKIANDVRWLACGPRSGLGELTIPENEPGSSIMPGKVNPTQCEAMTMVCCQVIGNDVAITIGGASRQLRAERVQAADHPQLPAERAPARRRRAQLRRALRARDRAEPREIDELLRNSLMLVTALNPHIGYDKAAKIAKHGAPEGQHAARGRDRARALTGEQFDAGCGPRTWSAGWPFPPPPPPPPPPNRDDSRRAQAPGRRGRDRACAARHIVGVGIGLDREPVHRGAGDGRGALAGAVSSTVRARRACGATALPCSRPTTSTLRVYVDGADEIDASGCMIKGGGAA